MDDQRWMRRAVDLTHLCPRSETAFAVGAVIVAGDTEIASGYSRDTDPYVHAEESALLRAAGDRRLRDATLYSTLEPCSKRSSRPHATCVSLIIAAGIPRVVLAWREPDIFVTCEGVALLIAAGIEVVELPEFAGPAMEANAHLIR
ncbi:deaminase [Actinoplanes sp. NPDC024001]|uniref:deaminase n=1 Tax=Actinoplanes sp. NPDC024001 TaxID=3154598 RepID=UPI0033D25162